VKGLSVAAAIAAEQQVMMMMFGGGDFSAELGVALDWEPLLVARSQFVMACAGAGVPAMDVPFIHLDDGDGLRREAEKAKSLGFAAKAAIHPSQISVLHDVFRPTSTEIAVAYDARAAFKAAGGAAVRFNGKMLEAPVMRRYEQVIAIGEKINA
jgi:(S)-citramalyl-CoA lyase